MKAFKVGDTLYTSNNKGEILEYTIEKVGRKYLTVSRAGSISYSVYKDSLKKYGDNYSHLEDISHFFRTKEELYAAREKRDLINRFRRHFDCIYGDAQFLSLNTLKQMYDLMEKELEYNHVSG